jgi:peptide/nickel transport system permease protein
MSGPVTSRLRRIRAFWTQFAHNRGALFGLLLLACVLAAAALAPLYSRDPLRIVGPAQIWPFADPRFPLGTDSLGRDIAAMMMHGARTTLLIGFAASLTAMFIGVTVGALAGYYGGAISRLLLRTTELFQTIPALILVLTIVTILGAEIRNIVIAIGIVSWPSIARMTRAEFMSWRNRDFVAACRTMGMGDAGLIIREILPNAISPVIALSALTVAGAILFESGLSFLGLGDPEVATWGRLVGEGRSFVRTSWYISVLPGCAILLTAFALNLVSDGLAEVLNPRRRAT